MQTRLSPQLQREKATGFLCISFSQGECCEFPIPALPLQLGLGTFRFHQSEQPWESDATYDAGDFRTELLDRRLAVDLPPPIKVAGKKVSDASANDALVLFRLGPDGWPVHEPISLGPMDA